MSMASASVQRGIALFQVLLMTAIFSMLLLLMVASVQQHQRQVQQLLDASTQQLALYSAANTLSFALLTEEWQGPDSGEQAYGWNFYSYPFDWFVPASSEGSQDNHSQAVVAIEARLQDLNGLLDLRFPSPLHQQWLQQQGIDSLSASQMVNTLRDAQRSEPAARLPFAAPGFHLQHASEAIALPGWQPMADSQLWQYTRVLGDEFNYLTAPDPILAALLPPAQFDILRQWRQQGRVDRFRFSELTGIEPDEGATFFASRELIMVLRLGQQQRQLQLRIDAGADIPVLIRQQHRGAR
ncbi:hypothetical protein [Alkalimonas amylolytica]|uniref:Type II secretion system protein K n=1 Tax=Alkalimonas amylolytica TaxID=152573 RepID=A0A1H4A161_ALKAM|nr:hypothetical protein [Alkalimonas amylolytica]SEA29620.1 hypothetical protein SAMN04488051_102448 [Alkalimonas amylolytica]